MRRPRKAANRRASPRTACATPANASGWYDKIHNHDGLVSRAFDFDGRLFRDSPDDPI